MDERRRVVIYRETLLASSEPWIVGQGEALTRYVPWYLGIRAGTGPPIPDGRRVMWRDGMLPGVRRFLWKEWAFAPSTVRILRRLRPALLHAHFGRDAVQLLPMARKLRLPLVVTFHGHDATRWDFDFAAGAYSDRLYLRRRQELVSTAARVLAVSAFIRSELLARGFPPGLVEVHYIGADVDAVAAESAETEPGLVVFAGRLVPWKGCDTLLSAAATARRAGVDLRLVVIGDGEQRGALERQSRDLGVSAEFLGVLPQEAVWRWFARAQVVAVPSRAAPNGWSEGFGLVALEAQAAGTPVVATDCGGLGEAVADCLRPRLVAEDDAEALARELCWFLDDAERAAEIGAKARDWVRRERDLARQTRRLEAIYDKVVAA